MCVDYRLVAGTLLHCAALDRWIRSLDAPVKQQITAAEKRMKQNNTIDLKVEKFQPLLMPWMEDKEDSY